MPESVTTALAVIVAVVLMILGVAWITEPARMRDATLDLAISLLHSLTLRFFVGVIVALIAARLWRDAQDRDVKRFGVTRHWGGLGAGEGGWEIEPAALHWFLGVLAAIALSLLAGVLLVPPVLEHEAHAPAGAPAPVLPSAGVVVPRLEGAGGAGQAAAGANARQGAAGH